MTVDMTIVSVTHNSLQVLPTFLRDLEATGLRAIIVDSGSEDPERHQDVICRQAANVEFVRLSQNVGFGTASNQGAERAATSLVAFVNPDVRFTRDTLDKLAACVTDSSQVFCAVPRLSDGLGVLDDNQRGFPLGRLTRGALRKSGTASVPSSSHKIVESASGCCMVIDRNIFDSLDGFDSRFFMFAEEIDLHRRAHNRGWRVAVVQDALVVTEGGASSEGVTSRWSAVERMVGHCQYVLYHHGLTVFLFDVLLRVAQIVSGKGAVPRAVSLRQFARGIWRVLSLRRSAA